MTFKKILLGSLSLAALTTFSTPSAEAAGFQLGEQSVVSMGRSFGGGGIVGDDLSAIVYNPAGITLAKGIQMQVGDIDVSVRSKFYGSYTSVFGTTTSGNAKISEDKQIPNFFATYQLNDNWTVGIGIFATYGFDLNYKPEDWFGKVHAVSSTLEALNVNPTVAYKINNEWSIGAGLSIEKGSARLTSYSPTGAFVKMKADDVQIGYNVGIMYEPTKDTRLGLSYRSRMKHKLEGTAFVTGEPDIYTNLELPAYATFGAYQKIGKHLGLSAQVRWTNWSTFKNLTVKRGATGTNYSDPTIENWRDTWYVGLGADWYINDKWTIRGGWGFDSSPIKDSTYRTARIPDNERYLLSCGVSYHLNDHLTIDAGYMHVFVDSAKINNKGSYMNGALTDSLQGVFKTEMNLFGLQMQYKF